VLLDSGGVLMQPIGGRWNPRADFEQILREHVPGLTDTDLAGAIGAGASNPPRTSSPTCPARSIRAPS